MLNQADYGRFSDLFSVYLKTIDNLSIKLLMFKWHDESFELYKLQDFTYEHENENTVCTVS